ncbi:MAG: hypothetical protein ACI83B_003842 [Sediminicola sp.]|jgi:hypothetical protein
MNKNDLQAKHARICHCWYLSVGRYCCKTLGCNTIATMDSSVLGSGIGNRHWGEWFQKSGDKSNGEDV